MDIKERLVDLEKHAQIMKSYLTTTGEMLIMRFFCHGLSLKWTFIPTTSVLWGCTFKVTNCDLKGMV